MNRQASIEKLLYVSLLLVFAAIGLGIFEALTLGHKLDLELQQGRDQILATQHQNKQLLDQVNKKSDEQEQQLKCIAELFTTTPAKKVTDADLVNCQIQAANPPTTANPASKFTVNSSASQKPSNPQSASSNSTNSTKPAPPKQMPVQAVINTVQKALGL